MFMDETVKENLTEETKQNTENTDNEESADLSALYDDSVQESVSLIQATADIYTEKYHEKPYGAMDIIGDIISFIISVLLAFMWTIIMLLILSFVLRSSWHLQIGAMLVISGVVSLAVAVFLIVQKTNKYIKLNDEKRKYKESSDKEE